MSAAIYLPHNADLDRVLADLPRELRPYREHAMLLLHFTGTKAWTDDLDDDGYARLSSLILRQYIPDRQIAAIIRHLEAVGVLERNGYSVGNKCTGYLVRPGFDGQPRRIELTDKRLIAKLSAWRSVYYRDHDDDAELAAVVQRRRPVLDSMTETLAMIRLDGPPGEVEADAKRQGANARHVEYIVPAIQHGDHYGLKVDGFGQRVHGIQTRTAKPVRRHLTFGGATLVELDVRNSQPLILGAAILAANLMRKINSPCARYIANAQHNGLASVSFPLPADLLSVPSSCLSGFLDACQSGSLYEMLMEVGCIADRDEAKRLLYRDVLFGRPEVCSPLTKAFARQWPGVFAWIQALKQRDGYKAVAKLLQRTESAIIVDGVCGRIVRELPDVRFLTVHDSTMVVSEASEQVKDIMLEEFKRYGVTATIRRTPTAT